MKLGHHTDGNANIVVNNYRVLIRQDLLSLLTVGEINRTCMTVISVHTTSLVLVQLSAKSDIQY